MQRISTRIPLVVVAAVAVAFVASTSFPLQGSPQAVQSPDEVRDAAGGVLGAENLTIPAFSNRIRNVFDLVPSVAQADRRQDDMLVTFSASRPMLMYLSAVDNVTSDAIFVMAEPAPALAVPSINSPPDGTINSPVGDVTIDDAVRGLRYRRLAESDPVRGRIRRPG